MPEKYRAPLMLCYLQGKTNEQAARELGWPPGTMSRRLAKGRELLRRRLTGRGITLSSALLATTLAEEASAVTVSPLLMHSTLKAVLLFSAGQTAVAGAISGQVAALPEGALKLMLPTKLKVLMVVTAALGVVAAGAGVVKYGAFAEDGPAGA